MSSSVLTAGAGAPRQQCADAVLMVRPAAFGFNPDTAATNTFQKAPADEGGDAQAAALTEFAQLAQALGAEGVEVCVAEDSAQPVKPDAVFPNNWVSFHPCGTLVTYPLANASRRPERRQAVIDAAVRQLHFQVKHLLDLSWYEGQGKYLEGTGSLVLDHVQRVAYACASARTDPELVREWAHELGYEPVIFTAVNRAGVPLYHTNVALWIGQQVAMVAREAITPADRERVLARLVASGREVITISQAELEHFAGNMLELGTWDEALGDSRVLVMSESARRVLAPQILAQLSACTDTLLAVPVPTIEALGGGSVRCMLAEVFRP
ncbi:MAG TPA: arginine deiminase-related protein [Steroidobacteraceae bacterium]|nr:arginine deiminase-related protein [Steroidobacteraceae bacterium]